MAGLIRGAGDLAADAAPAAARNGGGFLRGAARVAVVTAATGVGLTAVAGTSWYTYLRTQDGLSHEEALLRIEEVVGDGVERINRTFGQGQARAEAQIGLEGINSKIEAFGQFLSQFSFLRNMGLGIINWARDAQGLERKTFVNGELTLVSEATAGVTPAVPAAGVPLANTFNEQAFRTTFEGAVARTDLFAGMAPGIGHGGFDRAAATNLTIQRLEIGELIDTLENSTSNERVLAGLSAIEGNAELRAAFDTARQTGGINGITEIFTSIASNDQAAPAAVRAALGLTPAAP